MTNSSATYNRSVVCDLPDYPAGEITFELLTYFAAAETEGFPQKVYTLTLDANGAGTQVLPVPDNTGEAAWLWRVTLPDGNKYFPTLAYSASAIQLTAWLVSAVATVTAASIADQFVLKDGDTMTGQLNFSGTDHAGIKALSLTTAERDALTPAEGMVIYNETTSTVQVYQGGVWVSVGTGGAGAVDSVFGLTGDVSIGDLTAAVSPGVNSYFVMRDDAGAHKKILTTGLGYQGASSKLTAIHNVAWATDSMLRLTGTSTLSVIALAGHAWTLLQSANAAAARAAIAAAEDVHTHSYLANVVEDTTPQLGGNLDLNGNVITGLQVGTDVQAFDADTAKLDVAQNWSAAQNLQDNELTRPKLKDYGETVNAIGSIGGGTQDINLELGNVVSGTVDTSTTTFTFSNPSASGTACSFTLFLTNGGSQTVNWPASVDWAGGTPPTLTAAGIDVLTFVTLDGGTTWYGFPAGLNMG